MEQKELKIETASLAREAMADRQPGEDVDEALLRACKRLYGESGTFAFQALQSALDALSSRKKIDTATALRDRERGGAAEPRDFDRDRYDKTICQFAR